MGEFVIVAYKPKPGREADLVALVLRHVPALRSQQLVTDREPAIMRAADGTIVEVFEWRSAEATEQAHHDPVVQQLWAEFDELCTFVPVAEVPEARQMFSHFTPLA